MLAGIVGYNRLVMPGRPAWRQASDDALLAEFSGPPSVEIHRQVMALFHALAGSKIEGVKNLHPAYCSVLLVYDPLRWRSEDLVRRLEQTARKPASEPLPAARRLDVPVCCEAPFAPDLEPIAAEAGLTLEAAIARLAAAAYHVAFLGFAPGFPYLLGLPPELAAPRLERPRIRVPAGSVGIAGAQAGIYPAETPGGWRLIGRTPLRLFDASRQPMSRLLPGDEVHFSLIDARRFEELAGQ
ncbi:MAG: 5-oxoprolinase subunit PxpB [Bryobacteraceae bacterium]